MVDIADLLRQLKTIVDSLHTKYERILSIEKETLSLIRQVKTITKDLDKSTEEKILRNISHIKTSICLRSSNLKGIIRLNQLTYGHDLLPQLSKDSKIGELYEYDDWVVKVKDKDNNNITVSKSNIEIVVIPLDSL